MGWVTQLMSRVISTPALPTAPTCPAPLPLLPMSGRGWGGWGRWRWPGAWVCAGNTTQPVLAQGPPSTSSSHTEP